MRFVIVGLIVLIIGLAGIYGAGSSLPTEMTSIRGVQFRADSDMVWKVITDYPQLPEWNPQITRVEAIPDPENPQQTLWHLEDASGHFLVLRVSTPSPKQVHRREIVETDLPYSGTWEFDLTANEDGTFVKLTETCHIANPFRRFIAYYLIGSDDHIVQYFNALADHFVEEVEIQELAH